MKVLVCEDSVVDSKVIQVALQDEDVKTVFVTDGREAINLLRENNDFDLIITDIFMPHYNGDDILRLVREEQKKDTPIVMISADGSEEVIKLALKLGVDVFIEKPIDPGKVRKKLRKFLRG